MNQTYYIVLEVGTSVVGQQHGKLDRMVSVSSDMTRAAQDAMTVLGGKRGTRAKVFRYSPWGLLEEMISTTAHDDMFSCLLWTRDDNSRVSGLLLQAMVEIHRLETTDTDDDLVGELPVEMPKWTQPTGMADRTATAG